jgi:hypothetical protein
MPIVVKRENRFKPSSSVCKDCFARRWVGGPVADTRLLRLLSSLEVQFDAAVAREEDEAASDLAFSLRQGLLLRDVLRRGSWVARLDGGERPVVLVGRDFVVCSGPDSVLIPHRRLVATPSGSSIEAQVSGMQLVDTLRALCRSGAEVDVECHKVVMRGRLIQVGPDHVAVSTNSRPAFVAMEAIDLIRLVGPWGLETTSDGL